MTISTITPLPIPPSRSDAINFATRADAFMTALPAFVSETNEVATEIDAIGTSAQTSATAAAAQAAAAAASANTAAGHMATASSAAVTASAAASQTEAAYVIAEGKLVEFYQSYLGDYASNPTTDPLGNPLTVGTHYFNTVAKQTRYWDGTSWLTGNIVTATNYVTAPSFGFSNLGNVSGNLVLNYQNGPVFKCTVTGTINSISFSNWPTGAAGNARVMFVNPGAHIISFPTSWKWIKQDLSTTSNFADLQISLPISGIAIIDVFSETDGTSYYAIIGRN